jgi:hypothetical protein
MEEIAKMEAERLELQKQHREFSEKADAGIAVFNEFNAKALAAIKRDHELAAIINAKVTAIHEAENAARAAAQKL